MHYVWISVASDLRLQFLSSRRTLDSHHFRWWRRWVRHSSSTWMHRWASLLVRMWSTRRCFLERFGHSSNLDSSWWRTLSSVGRQVCCWWSPPILSTLPCRNKAWICSSGSAGILRIRLADCTYGLEGYSACDWKMVAADRTLHDNINKLLI